jgi:hypothetical protein
LPQRRPPRKGGVIAEVSGSWNEQYLKSVRIRECGGVLLPERASRYDFWLTDPLNDRFDLCSRVEIEHDHRLWVGIRRRVVATGRELELDVSSWNLEKCAVISVVALKSSSRTKTYQVPIESYDLLEPIGVPGHSNLHCERKPTGESCSRWPLGGPIAIKVIWTLCPRTIGSWARPLRRHCQIIGPRRKCNLALRRLLCDGRP